MFLALAASVVVIAVLASGCAGTLGQEVTATPAMTLTPAAGPSPIASVPSGTPSPAPSPAATPSPSPALAPAASPSPEPELTPRAVTPTPVPTVQLGTKTVEIVGFRHPDVSVRVGMTVVWNNRDAALHTVTAGRPEGPRGAWDSPRLGPGQSFEFTFTRAGIFPYYCKLHPLMRATVLVT